MGRITWESLPAAFRPLPGRTNVVVSRQPHFVASGAQVATSLQAALKLFPADQVVWLIGGAQLYAQAMPMASRLVVTDIDADFEGDAFAPEINPAIWHETHRSSHVSARRGDPDCAMQVPLRRFKRHFKHVRSCYDLGFAAL